jgi:hypothetical protein
MKTQDEIIRQRIEEAVAGREPLSHAPAPQRERLPAIAEHMFELMQERGLEHPDLELLDVAALTFDLGYAIHRLEMLDRIRRRSELNDLERLARQSPFADEEDRDSRPPHTITSFDNNGHYLGTYVEKKKPQS